MQIFKRAQFMHIPITIHGKYRRILNSSELIKFPLNCPKELGSWVSFCVLPNSEMPWAIKNSKGHVNNTGFLYTFPSLTFLEKLWKITVCYWRHKKRPKKDICFWDSWGKLEQLPTRNDSLESPKSKQRLWPCMIKSYPRLQSAFILMNPK